MKACLDSVNEKNSAQLKVSFTDFDDQPVVPNTVTYRIDNPETDEEIKADTTVPPASEVTILLKASEHEISGNVTGKRRVTVTATYGTDDQTVAEYDYDVNNLSGVS